MMQPAGGLAGTTALVLFDIDGTLLRPGPGPRRALGAALENAFGHQGSLADVRFGGKTDLLIVREAFPRAPPFSDPIWRGFWRCYLERLDAELAAHPPLVLPGVAELLAHLDGRPGCVLTLVTGNIPDGAATKLAHAKLAGHFPSLPLGAYATDGTSKAELGVAARRRSEAVWGSAARHIHHVLIGDTHADVACARQGGFRAVAVATGSFSAPELERSEADAVLLELRPLEAAIEALFAGATPIG